MMYLMNYTPFDFSTNTGKANCKVSCDAGFTSNGDALHECEECSETCDTCMDNDKVGDKDKCTTCSLAFPFMYSPTSTCMVGCGIGFYQVDSKTCDACNNPCMDCGGDKFNCTLCDATAPEKTLFTQTM